MSSTQPQERPGSRPSAAQIWWSAIRPATLWAGAVPVIVGTALALADGAREPLRAAAALLGALLIQIGCNLVNDYSDFHRGADGPDRLGPARATAKGWLTPRQVALGAAVSLGLAGLCGLYITAVGGAPLFALGLASIAAAVLYTAGPYPLAYLGLGDVFVLAFFGFGATAGTYYLQTEALTAAPLWAGFAVGALATAILVVNNLRDRHTDLVAGKRTLAVRLGPAITRAQYTALVLGAYIAVVAAVFAGAAGPGWLLAFGSLPLALRTIRAVRRTDGAALNPLLGATARLELIFGLLLAAGALLWS